MDAEFWHGKWARRELGFHQAQAHPFLVAWLAALELAPRSRVLVPLCGKTLDIGWLLASGYRVAGVELSETAIDELFDELGIQPEVTALGALKRYTASSIDIFVGDIFELSASALGPVDAIYDRAALVALPERMRAPYAEHLVQITQAASQLLVCFEYDQQCMAGPPFSVSADEVRLHYAGRYLLRCAERADVPGGLKGTCPAQEVAWLLLSESRAAGNGRP